MSWSFSHAGKPEAVLKQAQKYSGQLSGSSKDEFDKILPAIQAFCESNICTEVAKSFGYGAIVVKIDGHGSASKTNGEIVYSTCRLNMDYIPGFVE